MTSYTLKKLSRLALCTALLACLISCSIGQDSSIRRQNKVEPAILGQYQVLYGTDSTVIGELSIGRDGYVFILAPFENQAIDMEQVKERLFFVQNPQGTFSLEYNGQARPDSPLDQTENHETLATIIFSSESADPVKAAIGSGIDQMFLIRVSHSDHQFYFHSVVGEFQMWGVSKVID